MSVLLKEFDSKSQWRFYVGARGQRPPNLAQPPDFT